jgi:pSer/pThr/pTyr-binding forkhead associated (FHA) protein
VSKLTLSFKGRVLRIFPLQQGAMQIGSAPDCKIHIDSLAVEPKHARIETHGQDSILFDQSTTDGVFVGQTKVSEHKLVDGEIIRIGKHTLMYNYEEASELNANESSTSIDIHPIAEKLEEMPETQVIDSPSPPAETESKRQGWLQILNGQNLGKTLSLNKSMTNLGKPGVATAVITKRPDGYFISHLEGKKSPQVGGEEIGDRSIKLEDGVTITIGNIQMQFYLA